MGVATACCHMAMQQAAPRDHDYSCLYTVCTTVCMTDLVDSMSKSKSSSSAAAFAFDAVLCRPTLADGLLMAASSL